MVAELVPVTIKLTFVNTDGRTNEHSNNNKDIIPTIGLNNVTMPINMTKNVNI